jgi:DNA polymerase-3 subunit epsilon
MRWLTNLLNRHVQLTTEQITRLNHWHKLPSPSAPQLLHAARFVVVDVETSGLNLSKDYLIAIGAVAIENGKIAVSDSFDMVLQQAHSSSKQNILIHGISGATQVEGVDPVEVLLAFLEYVKKDPLIAFHVAFDETMLRKSIRQHLGFDFKHIWLDLAYATPALYPDSAKRSQGLDEWLRHFQIQNYARHNALADAVSTAQLFLFVQHAALQKNIADLAGLRLLEKSQQLKSANDF